MRWPGPANLEERAEGPHAGGRYTARPVGFLTDIVTRVRRDLAEHPLDEAALRAAVSRRPPAQPFDMAITSGQPAVIAEVKRASPSAGSFATAVDPAAQAAAYEAGGAAAVSVLTEATHFGGSLEDLRLVRGRVAIPVMRKDFVVHRSQVLEARAAGADAVLLITACLADDDLLELLDAARSLGMEPLVETHDEHDLARALATDARVIGVNARDLESLEVDLQAALERLRHMPADRVTVLESGVATREQALAAVRAGASAILVGEALMRAPDPTELVRRLRGHEEAAR